MASSSSSSSSPDSKSGVYTFRLYFYDEVDNQSAGKDYSMTNDELLQRLGKLIDTSEVIQEVMYYTNPLNGWQLYKGAVKPTGLENLQGNMHHAYIVFGTKNWWWSVEKNDACVAIQRSKTFEFVSKKYYRGHRQTSVFTGIDCVKKKTGQQSRTVEQLLEHIVARDYVNQKYHFLDQNCQHLADKIYDYL
ncbi:hypothetical protein DAPPUDRAFT_105495 [Daphnia pulex]|uniref:PPPDE domain-containing protein n=1 Tax=Daphnia pulex TaxID=6669 RepID=E9GQZ5_DAPPU|nr:hypothetical protein DAPPUDRAFT_105495 [Daphnia pulex]|eukprot:EFX78203.1 hypothetical protein DAPPUDRAFT_105495 [Daphnia pulex]